MAEVQFILLMRCLEKCGKLDWVVNTTKRLAIKPSLRQIEINEYHAHNTNANHLHTLTVVHMWCDPLV